MKEDKKRELLIGLPIKIFGWISVIYLYKKYNFPIGLAGALLLSLSLIFFAVIYRNDLQPPIKVSLSLLIISSGILSLLFAYDHYISDIRITVIHIMLLMGPPIIYGNYMIKKNKQQT